MRTSADSWQVQGSSLKSCCSASSAHGTAHTEAQTLGLLACLATSNFKRSLVLGGVPVRPPPAALLRKCERLQIAGRQKGLAWKAVAQGHVPMALLTQRHRDWGCFLVLPPQTSDVGLKIEAGTMPVSYRSPAPKMRTSADCCQAEEAILESCCSASSAHGTARTEAQRLSLFSCLATLNFKCSLRMGGGSCQASSVIPSTKMRTCANSWEAERASLGSCCSASSAHGTARTEAQRLGLLACLATSKSKRRLGGPCRMPLSALLRKCEHLQIAGR